MKAHGKGHALFLYPPSGKKTTKKVVVTKRNWMRVYLPGMMLSL